MAKKVLNPDFFKNRDLIADESAEYSDEKSETGADAASPPDNADISDKKAENVSDKTDNTKKAEPLRISEYITDLLKETAETLELYGFKHQSAAIEKAYNDAYRECFSVAVVGEFSRGKSTFINRLLGGKILPEGDLPTTAMMTRIRYGKGNVLIAVDENGRKTDERKIAGNSPEQLWSGLISENFTENKTRGTVFIGIDSKWLGKNSIEIIDTPGAGDLEESRAAVIGDALMRCDGVIVAVDATQALSMSEMLFIRQRLMTRKLPFIMMILTKLDRVPENERVEIVEYVMRKLKQGKIDMPVYIPYDVKLSDGRFNDITGLENVKKEIVSWVTAPERVRLTEQWLAFRAIDALNTSEAVLVEKKGLINANNEERLRLLEQKKFEIDSADIKWEEILNEMQKRCAECCERISSTVDEYSQTMIERLQYEAANSANPHKWWNENYPYRVKTELANLAAVVENRASKIIGGDTQWLNSILTQCFKSNVLGNNDEIIDKSEFTDVNDISRQEFKDDITKKRHIFRIGTAVVTIAGALALASLGGMVLVANLGISAGASVISDNVFKKKIEEQREAIKEAIAKNIPRIVAEASSECSERIICVYNSITEESRANKDTWLRTQREYLENSLKPADNAVPDDIDRKLSVLKLLSDKYNAVV